MTRYFAMVVVVQAESEDEAHDMLVGADPSLQFVGDPWECRPVTPRAIGRVLAEGYEPEFETLSTLEWREPKRRNH